MTTPEQDKFHYTVFDTEYEGRFKTLEEATASAKDDYSSGVLGVYKLVAVVGKVPSESIPVTLIKEPKVKTQKSSTKKKGKK